MFKGFTSMLDALKQQANRTLTENGAATLNTTRSDCLDLFATIGALRNVSQQTIIDRFHRAYAENPDIAMRILFYGRDVRGGLGERRVFRVLLHELAEKHPESVRKNLKHVAEMGRYDDLFSLMDTSCQTDVVELVKRQLKQDLYHAERGESISLLAKWLPSVNTSSEEAVQMGKLFARKLGMSDSVYRKTLSRLRTHLRILENSLRERDYTFSYETQPSRAMYKYRRAFLRNDEERYLEFMEKVAQGKAALHTSSLSPSDLVDKALDFRGTQEERMILNTTWNALEDFTDERNALCVVDTSGSMFWQGKPHPFAVAMSLGLYFAQRRLIEIKGRDFVDQVQYCRGFSEVADTNIQAVFELILNAAISNRIHQSDMPETIYIISDMEFNRCTRDASASNFEYAKKLYRDHGYRLPRIVFWNVQSRNTQQPVDMNEQGVALVSGYTPRLFNMALSRQMNPHQAMMDTLNSERYACIRA